MIRLVRLAVLAALLVPLSGWSAPALIVLVRHAEKEALPAANPPLTPAGRERAQELARVVEVLAASGIPLRAIFATEVARTQQTVAPLSASAHVATTVVNAQDKVSLVKKVIAIHGGIAVIAGHSNTLPAIVEALGGPSGIVIADDQFNRLFLLTKAGTAQAKLAALTYGK